MVVRLCWSCWRAFPWWASASFGDTRRSTWLVHMDRELVTQLFAKLLLFSFILQHATYSAKTKPIKPTTPAAVIGIRVGAAKPEEVVSDAAADASDVRDAYKSELMLEIKEESACYMH